MHTPFETSNKAPEQKNKNNKTGFPKGRFVLPKAIEEIQKLLGGHSMEREFLIENLHIIQDRHNQLPASLLAALAQKMSLSQAEVYEVASFYHHFKVIKEEDQPLPKLTVRICDGIACEMSGATNLFRELSKQENTDFNVVHAPCVGACNSAPVAVVGQRQIPLSNAKKVMRAITMGEITPVMPTYENLNTYRSLGGYEKLIECKANLLSREHVLDQLEKSGLRGMGGAGFPVFRKWKFLEGKTKPRAIVVNADEGEPGTFKDRLCFGSSPHKVLEGMLIAAWVVEAEDAYIYLRDEYPEVRQILLKEIAALEKAKLTDGVVIHLRRGAGAYICGEESALLESIEGKRGLPRNRPPYPAEQGLFGKPTLINNVETLYWVCEILRKGPDWYIGEGCPRFYSVSGRINKPGIVLAPSGVTAIELINDYCGGMTTGHDFKAYLPGGASGGILPASMAELPLDFGTLEEHGCFVGSAAVVIFSNHDQIPDVALNLIKFFADESCGQCTPCRLGCDKMIELIQKGNLDDNLIDDLSNVMHDASICGLGQAAPNPIASGLKHFKGEFK